MSLGRTRPVLIGGIAAGAVLAMTATLSPAQAVTAGFDMAPTSYCGAGADTTALTTGQELHGWTVVDGTTPVEFTANVMGVLKQGIDARTDLIIVDAGDPDPGPGEGAVADMSLTGNAAIERAGGVWEGMSGSPVYDSAGELVGAISYGLSEGPSHVIGLTPYSAMQQYAGGGTGSAPATPAVIPVKSEKMAVQIASAADTTKAQAAQGFTPLAVPTTISGVSSKRLSRAAAKFTKSGTVHTSFTSDAAGGSTSLTPGAVPADVLTGGDNIGAMDVYGDVTEGGVGTVTAVCGNDLVAYGHPQDDTGTTSVAMMTEDALGVQDDSLDYPFKISNNGDVVGEITGDHTTGISGEVGQLPADAATFTGTATYDGGAAASLTSYSATPTYWADAAYYDLVGAGDVATQAQLPGGAAVQYTITGVDGSGKTFTLKHSDRYAANVDVVGQAGYDLGNLVSAMSGIRNLTLTSVQSSMSVDDDSTVWRLVEIDQKLGGRWTKVDGAALARAGKTLALHGVLQDKTTGATTVVPINVAIPRSDAGAHGTIGIMGGNSIPSYPSEFTNVAAASAFVKSLVPHDSLRLVTTLIKRKRTKVTTITKESGKVTAGSKSIMVVVR